MKTSKVLVSLLGLILLIVGFLVSTSYRKTTTPIKPTLRIGYMDWPGFYPVVLAHRAKKFDNKNYEVSLTKAKDNAELNSLVSTGKLDLCFGALADHLWMNGNDMKVKFIYATDFSNSDVLLVDPKIKKPKDLENKRISVTDLNSFSEFFLLSILENHHVDSQKVALKIIPFDKVLDSLESKTIHAGHTWEPETDKALKKGYKILANSSELKGIITDGLLATEEAINAHPDYIADFLYEFEGQLRRLEKLTPEEEEFLAEHFSSSIQNIRTGIKTGVELLDLQKNKELFQSSQPQSLAFWTKRISDFYGFRGQLKTPVSAENFLDSTLIKKSLDRQQP